MDKEKKPKASEIVKKINPNLQIGEVLDNRYKVVTFKKITAGDTLIRGGDGYVADLLENEKMYIHYL
jgi:hypothetical protein